MRIDISLLPALAAAFMLVFARIGAMVMLLPGLGESNIPVRVKLAIALMLTLVILPLHRSAYQIDMQSLTSLLILMLREIVIGIGPGAADAADAVLFCRRAVVDHGRLSRACRRHRGHDGNLPRLLHRRDARFDAAQVRPFSPWPTRTTHQTRQKTRRKNVSTKRLSGATSPKARKSTPGS